MRRPLWRMGVGGGVLGWAEGGGGVHGASQIMTILVMYTKAPHSDVRQAPATGLRRRARSARERR